jgi:transposase
LGVSRRTWRGWRIVLFLDSISAQHARASQTLAAELGIELRWLPKACPELNPVDYLWWHLKKDILANEPIPNLEATLKRARSYWWWIVTRSPTLSQSRLHRCYYDEDGVHR